MTNYYHPFKPYDIQVELMDKIYELLDNGNNNGNNNGNDTDTKKNSNTKKIGLFESPTGTGKTLSLICSTLSWLRNNKEKILLTDSLNNTTPQISDDPTSVGLDDSDDEPDWITDSYNKNLKTDKLNSFKDLEEKIHNYKSNMTPNMKKDTRQSISYKKRKIEYLGVKIDKEEEEEDTEFLLNDYVSDETKLQNQVQYLLSKFDQSNSGKRMHDSSNNFKQPVRIIFASRTHSQLQQLASQLNLPQFPSSFDHKTLSKETIKYLPLGSRKQLCCNKKISKLKSIDLINEGCQDAVKNSKCEYYKPQDTILQKLPIEAIFNKVNDIEDIQLLGETFQACPYYASRKSIDYAEIISVPYQLLLMHNSRNSLNLDLKNSIVIIDEAHNLIDTILNLNKCNISLKELLKIIESLKNYLNKFNKKLSTQNRIQLLKLLKFLNLINDYILQNYKKNVRINPNDILKHGNLDVYNFNELVEFIRQSKLAYKLQSYINKEALKNLEKNNTDNISTDGNIKGQPLLFKVITFIECLRNPSYEGIFYFTEVENHLEYMLLEPSEIFKPIVQDCHKLILCGGTMEPMKEFTQKLFPYIPEDDLLKFSCNHVIPDDNLKVFNISTGLENKKIEYQFTFDKKNDPVMLKSLGDTLLKIFQITPMGVVIFAQSYQYLKQLIDFWKQSGQFKQMDDIKKIFFEGNVATHDALKEYSENILEKQTPSCLFAVVGGKLSEGINFQDDLARSVILLGLPYPNIFSSDMVVQRNHIFKKFPKQGREVFKNYIDMICMRSVNQSVGRAIRHIDDYATIYLVDKRFEQENIKSSLSNWVKKRIMPSNTDVIAETKQFFTNR